MRENIWLLKQSSLFESLTPDESQRLGDRARARAFPKGSVIYFPDEPGESVLLLTRGRVKIIALTPDGREMLLAFIDPGELFGELAVLDRSPRNEHAEAVENCQILSIPREELLWLIDQKPSVAMSVTKLIGLRLRRVEARLKNLLFRSVRQRIIGILLEFLESHGRMAGDRWEIGLRLSHQEFANLIGATRERVTLTLGQLQREGLIVVVRKRVIVLDRPRLAAEGASGSAETERPAAKRVEVVR